MLASEIRDLKAGDKLILRKWDSLDEAIRAGVTLEVVKIAKRFYGPVLVAKWGDDECEFKFGDYLDCLQRENLPEKRNKK
jgi:hypothetical protein